MILGPFCGVGWAEALRSLGLREVGIDTDPAVCATRMAAGHRATIRADVAAFPLHHLAGRVQGLVASPPCQAFSRAGKRLGIADLPALFAHVAQILRAGRWLPYPAAGWHDARSPLVLEPLRYALELRPAWVALEQVEDVLPLWRSFAHVLGRHGYSTWAGILCAADYGIVLSCPLHDLPTADALLAGRRSVPRTALEHARVPASTGSSQEPIGDAWIVAAHLARATQAAFAAAATCDERAQALVALAAHEARPTRNGRAADEWTNAVTSEFGWTGDIAVSIASWLRGCWDDLYAAGKLSTTSTATPPTTIRRISRSTAATLITGLGTGPASRTAGCGLCLDLGVPQTRYRAILMAHRDRPRVDPPAPTHHLHGGMTLFGDDVPRHESMAAALGWDGMLDPRINSELGGGRLVRYERGTDRPSPVVRGNADRWLLRSNTQDHAAMRSLDQPASTIFTGGRLNDVSWVRERPAPTVVGGRRSKDGALVGRQLPPGEGQEVGGWAWRRPVTTVQGDPRVPRPGPGDRAGGEHQQDGAVRVTLDELAILQGMPAGYPWQGTKTQISQQIGNLIPPPLAAAIVAALAGIDREAVA